MIHAGFSLEKIMLTFLQSELLGNVDSEGICGSGLAIMNE